jgi:hypothetical protein
MADKSIYTGEVRRIDEWGEFVAPTIERPTGTVPEIVPMPALADMVEMSDADLRATLARHGVFEPWPQYVAHVQKYVTQFSSMSSGSPEWQERVDALLDLTPRDDGRPSRALLGLARRTQERYTTMEAIDGNEKQLLCWISEGDDRVCAGCDLRAGDIGTIAEHEEQGLPGNMECGDNCRCQLVAVD